LRDQTITENLTFPPSMMWEMFAARDDLLMFNKMVIEVQEKILSLLLALNNMYYWGSFKWADVMISYMPIKPHNLMVDMKGHYRLEPKYSAKLLLDNILAIIELVENLSPHIQTGNARAQLTSKRF